MFGNSTELRCCEIYPHTTTTIFTRRSALASAPQFVESPCRVLIVEFRDEVYADLRSVFEDYGCEVMRASNGASVAARVRRFTPNLALVNESMPDESGWLIAGKLRLTRREPVWLYTDRKPDVGDDWKGCIGVDEILVYGGVVSQLRLRVRERLERWPPICAEYLRGAESRPTATTAPAVKCASWRGSGTIQA